MFWGVSFRGNERSAFEIENCASRMKEVRERGHTRACTDENLRVFVNLWERKIEKSPGEKTAKE